jgi:hypothetical protein
VGRRGVQAAALPARRVRAPVGPVRHRQHLAARTSQLRSFTLCITAGGAMCIPTATAASLKALSTDDAAPRAGMTCCRAGRTCATARLRRATSAPTRRPPSSTAPSLQTRKRRFASTWRRIRRSGASCRRRRLRSATAADAARACDAGAMCAMLLDTSSHARARIQLALARGPVTAHAPDQSITQCLLCRRCWKLDGLSLAAGLRISHPGLQQ